MPNILKHVFKQLLFLKLFTLFESFLVKEGKVNLNKSIPLYLCKVSTNL